VGSQMTFVALPWFVLVTTGSATRMSLVLAAQLTPLAVLGIPSGTVVSKLGARRTMVYSDLARVPLMVSIPLLHSYGKLSFPALPPDRRDRRESRGAGRNPVPAPGPLPPHPRCERDAGKRVGSDALGRPPRSCARHLRKLASSRRIRCFARRRRRAGDLRRDQ